MNPTAPPATALVTGAAAGLGLETAARLLDAGWHVLVTARSTERADTAVADLQRRTRRGVAVPLACDLGELAGVGAAVAGVRAMLAEGRLPPLRALVGCAGVQAVDAVGRTADGLELTFGTNVVGHFALVDGLLDVLAAPSRVVLVGSGTHWGDLRHNLGLVPAPVWRTPEQLATPGTAVDASSVRAGRTAYATSKLALVHLTHELAHRGPAGMVALTFDPGLMPGTGLARHAGRVESFAWRYLLPALRVLPEVGTPAASARHLAELATGARDIANGGNAVLGRTTPSSPASYDPVREAELWAYLRAAAQRS